LVTGGHVSHFSDFASFTPLIWASLGSSASDSCNNKTPYSILINKCLSIKFINVLFCFSIFTIKEKIGKYARHFHAEWKK